jgi:hypothetical protein
VESGGQKGNKNAARGAEWREAVVKAIKRGQGLDKLADVLVAKALDGDMVAIKEVGDRLDGKPKQQVDLNVTEIEPKGPDADILNQRLGNALANRSGFIGTPNTVR